MDSPDKTLCNEDADSGFENGSDSSQGYCDSTPDCDESSSNSDNEDSSPEKIDSRQNDFLKLEDLTEDSGTTNVGNDFENLLKTHVKNKVKESDLGNTLEFYKSLMKGQYDTIDFGINSITEKPIWLDEEKFKRGQKFATSHLFCINYAEMVSLFILFAQKSSLGPLIFTKKSVSPFSAFKRYLSTVIKLISWYSDDLWNDDQCEGKKNLKTVRTMHERVYTEMTNLPQDELSKRITLGSPTTTAVWCPMRDLLVTDFRESVACPPWNHHLEKGISRAVWVNQADMSITQFGFVGLAVTYPKAFGIHLATEEDLDAFLHMWRALGFLLGVKDEYNFCNGNLNMIRERTMFYLEVVAKPAFRNVTTDWEHMCRCLTSGISFYVSSVSFEPSLLYLCHVLKIETPRLRAKMTLFHYLIYQIHRFVFYLLKFPRVLTWLNARLYHRIRKAQAVPSEILKKWEKKEFPYMKQSGKCPIRGQVFNT